MTLIELQTDQTGFKYTWSQGVSDRKSLQPSFNTVQVNFHTFLLHDTFLFKGKVSH